MSRIKIAENYIHTLEDWESVVVNPDEELPYIVNCRRSRSKTKTVKIDKNKKYSKDAIKKKRKFTKYSLLEDPRPSGAITAATSNQCENRN